jgi:hypothetical protein
MDLFFTTSAGTATIEAGKAHAAEASNTAFGEEPPSSKRAFNGA